MTTSRRGHRKVVHTLKRKVVNHLRKRHHRMFWAAAIGVVCVCLYIVYKSEVFKLGAEGSLVPVVEAFIAGLHPEDAA